MMRDGRLREALESAGIIYEHSSEAVMLDPNRPTQQLRKDIIDLEVRIKQLEDKIDVMLDYDGRKITWQAAHWEVTE